MTPVLRTKDILGWDVKNWSKALKYWSAFIPKDKKLKCLELGANKGGISLWLASQGHDVICSDIEVINEETRNFHKQFQSKGNIFYEKMDAVNIPYENHFDIIILKSVLGGVGRGGHTEKVHQTMTEIHKALKPGGVFLFAENLAGTRLHIMVRESFKKWVKNNWNYLRLKDVPYLFRKFKEYNYGTTGFTGAFGFYEPVRNILGTFDAMLDFLPGNWHYIIYGHSKK
jgi:2-polyprenyl-3-methyl-5-hydroxy-6-metoxy-1,4-benzoquinol methylase